MSEFGVVRGLRLRATKVNSCGLPIAGPGNRLVTKGFITAQLDPEMKAAEDLEQQNAAGEVCVAERTPPERKWHNIQLELCKVNTELISLLNGWPQILDPDDIPIGFRDQAKVDGDYGVALEIWTGGKDDDDCAIPTNDSIFSAPTSGRKYGYLLFAGKEFTLGAINIGSSVSTFTLNGISLPMSNWGRGPYNVAAIDTAGTPGRLLEPMDEESHLAFFRTPVPPPALTNGAVPLNILQKFAAPNYYFGGPANEPEADVAPDQDTTEATLTITATGGTYNVTVDGTPTANLAFGAVNTAIAAAINNVPGIDGATVTGTGPFDIEVPGIHTLGLITASLTGGSATLT